MWINAGVFACSKIKKKYKLYYLLCILAIRVVNKNEYYYFFPLGFVTNPQLLLINVSKFNVPFFMGCIR